MHHLLSNSLAQFLPIMNTGELESGDAEAMPGGGDLWHDGLWQEHAGRQ